MSEPNESLLGGFPAVDYAQWRQEVERGLKGADFAKRLVTKTLEGIDVEPLYTAADALAGGPLPGLPPYVRGGDAVPHAERTWDMRARIEQPDPSAARAEIAADLARGARSLWLCFDGDARAGRAGEEAPRDGACGLPCLTAAQLGELLSEVPLERIALALDAGANALPVAACALAAARARGLAADTLSGSFDADPIAALMRDGALPFSLDMARSQLVDLARYCSERAPRVRAITVSTRPYHDAGASAAQELGYALATSVLYLRWLIDGGLSPDRASAQIGFRVGVGGDFFMEIAKLRALRQTWAGVVAACAGGPDAQRTVIHAVTSVRCKSARDPWVNMLRETTECFSAAVGGADALTTHGFDRTLGLSDGFARRIAANTQVILNEEAHVTRAGDPGGGAYYVEQLTDQLARGAWASLQAIEHEGDMATAVLSGRVASEIGTVAEQRRKLLATRRQAITGVSEFAKVDEERVVRPEPAWDAATGARRAALAAAGGDESVVQALRAARASGQNIVEAAIDAAGRGATLAHISSALGAGEEPAAHAARLPVRRHAAAYEALRDLADEAAARGARPRVFLGNLGSIPEHQARAQFASGFFAAGGFDVLSNDGFATPTALADAFAGSGTPLCVLCGTDVTYPELVPECARLLAQRGARRIVVAGRPRDAELEQRFREAGVTDFVFVGSDVVETLRGLLADQGASA